VLKELICYRYSIPVREFPLVVEHLARKNEILVSNTVTKQNKGKKKESTNPPRPQKKKKKNPRYSYFPYQAMGGSVL
jgi:hypothetical protein